MADHELLELRRLRNKFRLGAWVTCSCGWGSGALGIHEAAQAYGDHRAISVIREMP